MPETQELRFCVCHCHTCGKVFLCVFLRCCGSKLLISLVTQPSLLISEVQVSDSDAFRAQQTTRRKLLATWPLPWLAPFCPVFRGSAVLRSKEPYTPVKLFLTLVVNEPVRRLLFYILKFEPWAWRAALLTVFIHVRPPPA